MIGKFKRFCEWWSSPEPGMLFSYLAFYPFETTWYYFKQAIRGFDREEFFYDLFLFLSILFFLKRQYLNLCITLFFTLVFKCLSVVKKGSHIERFKLNWKRKLRRLKENAR